MMNECRFKKYMDRWHMQHPGEHRDCVYWLELSKEERKYCDSIECRYRPKVVENGYREVRVR